MAKPKTYEIRRLALMTCAMWARIQALMKAEGKSFAEVAREALEMLLNSKER